MQPIVSGTTKERIIRTTILAILFSGYSAWLLWDGYITYPRANLRSALKNRIGVELQQLPVVDPQLTAERVKTIPQNSKIDLVRNQLGEPHLKHNHQWYYFGEAGYLSIQVDANKKAFYRWMPGPLYRSIDIRLQRILGIGLLPVGFGMIIQLVRVLRTRVALSKDGLLIRGRPLIPTEDIQFIVTPDADKNKSANKARVHYTRNGEEKILLLDAYVVKELPAILEAMQKQIDQRKSME